VRCQTKKLRGVYTCKTIGIGHTYTEGCTRLCKQPDTQDVSKVRQIDWRCQQTKYALVIFACNLEAGLSSTHGNLFLGVATVLQSKGAASPRQVVTYTYIL